jgi:hypothetical protein
LLCKKCHGSNLLKKCDLCNGDILDGRLICSLCRVDQKNILKTVTKSNSVTVAERPDGILKITEKRNTDTHVNVKGEVHVKGDWTF